MESMRCWWLNIYDLGWQTKCKNGRAQIGKMVPILSAWKLLELRISIMVIRWMWLQSILAFPKNKSPRKSLIAFQVMHCFITESFFQSAKEKACLTEIGMLCGCWNISKQNCKSWHAKPFEKILVSTYDDVSCFSSNEDVVTYTLPVHDLTRMAKQYRMALKWEKGIPFSRAQQFVSKANNEKAWLLLLFLSKNMKFHGFILVDAIKRGCFKLDLIKLFLEKSSNCKAHL